MSAFGESRGICALFGVGDRNNAILIRLNLAAFQQTVEGAIFAPLHVAVGDALIAVDLEIGVAMRLDDFSQTFVFANFHVEAHLEDLMT